MKATDEQVLAAVDGEMSGKVQIQVTFVRYTIPWIGTAGAGDIDSQRTSPIYRPSP